MQNHLQVIPFQAGHLAVAQLDTQKLHSSSGSGFLSRFIGGILLSVVMSIVVTGIALWVGSPAAAQRDDTATATAESEPLTVPAQHRELPDPGSKETPLLHQTGPELIVEDGRLQVRQP